MDDGRSSSSSSSDADEEKTCTIQFNQATQHVQNETMNPDGVKLDSKTMLTLYGLFKVATVGKCQESKPGIFDPKGRTKWTAWNDLSNLSKVEAMDKYISTVKKNYSWVPNEIRACCSSSSSQKHVGNKSVMGGNAVSTFALVSDDDNESTDDDHYQDSIFTSVKENQLDFVENWLKQKENDPNKQDKGGLTLLHWAVDRGHLQVCQLLLRYGSNPNLPDCDGDTSLDYAITCDHMDIVELLKEKVQELSLD